MTDAIDLTSEQRNQLSALLHRFLPDVAVWAYGSRVKWTARPNSDLDLVAFTTPAQQRQVADLKDALAESNLPFPVDLHVWDDVPERFREIIRKEYVAVQEAKEPESKPSMPDGWRTRPLGELVEIFDGPHATPAKTQTGPIFLGISNLVQGRVNLSEVEHLSEDDYIRWTRRVEPRAGDVVFSYETRLGEAARVPQGLRCCLGRRMGLLRARSSEIDERFLLYAYLGTQFQETLRARTVPGSTVDRIPLIDMPQFPMAVPTDLVEQRAIAHILGTLDDKIELNRQMNETLEAMARALFKSWFIDFEPVRAKAKGRDPGLPKHIADLFPDSFEDSELGEIPKGWKVKPLSDLTSYFSRGIGPSYIDKGGVCVLNQKCIRDRRVNFSESRRHDSTKRPIEGRELRALDILVNSTGIGTLGRVAQVWYLPETAIVDSHVTVVRAANDVNPWFFGVALLYREREIEELGEGSTGQTELSRARLGALTCLVPTAYLQVAFGKITSQLLLRIAENGRGSLALEAIRDTLLPKLISGELRVKNGTHLTKVITQ